MSGGFAEVGVLSLGGFVGWRVWVVGWRAEWVGDGGRRKGD